MRVLALLCACVLLFCSCSGHTSSVDNIKPLSENEPVLLEKPSEQPLTALTPASPVFRSCAYLPINALPEDISDFAEEYSQNLEALDYLILNTAVYWNENGELQVSDKLSETVGILGKDIPLHCTVNPRGALIREGSAGQTIDTEEERQALADVFAYFAETNNLSGIDIDWEFPLENEWADFSEFIVTLNEALEDISREIFLSLALYPQDISLSGEAISAIDHVNVMAYDQFGEDGRHSTMQTAESSVNYFLSLGFEPRQLVLGIPAYGRPLDGSARWVFYKDIDLSALSPDEPDLVGDIYFNSPSLAADKADFAKENGLSGVMLYHLLCDRAGESSLTEAITPGRI